MKKVSKLFIALAAIIFLAWKVLKSIFSKVSIIKLDYYEPVTVHVYPVFDTNQEMIITDFSEFKDKNIVKFYVGLKMTKEEIIQQACEEHGWNVEDLDEETYEWLEETTVEAMSEVKIIENAVVYEVAKGVWRWCLPQDCG